MKPVPYPATAAKAQAEDHERDQLRKLVSDELKRYGLLLTQQVRPVRDRWRTSKHTFTFYGQSFGPPGFVTRELLHEGSFKDCCIRASELLDALDAAQVPDTAAG